MPDILIPVFVFPNNLTFNLLDQSTHKQVLTLYNPYEFPVRYQVLCSARDKHKYTVVDPEGCIQSHSCIDIVVRHNEVSNQNVGHIDKFRIQMYQYSSNKFIGKKDVRAELLAEKEDDHQSVERETFQELPMTSISQAQQQFSLPRRQGRPNAPNGLVVCVALICVTALLLPSHGDESTILPDYLKPTTHLKLVMSYVLASLSTALAYLFCVVLYVQSRHRLAPLLLLSYRRPSPMNTAFFLFHSFVPWAIRFQLFGHNGFVQAKLGPGRKVQELVNMTRRNKCYFNFTLFKYPEPCDLSNNVLDIDRCAYKKYIFYRI